MLRHNAVITIAVIVLMSIVQIVDTIPAPYIPANNETVTFDFYVQDVTNMYAWAIEFEFNPKELEFIEFTTSQKGYFLHDFSSKHKRQTFKVFAVQNKTERTRILTAEVILGWPDVQASGSGKLCSFTFKKLVATSEPTITLMEDLVYTYYCTWEGLDKPLPMFMNMSEP